MILRAAWPGHRFPRPPKPPLAGAAHKLQQILGCSNNVDFGGLFRPVRVALWRLNFYVTSHFYYLGSQIEISMNFLSECGFKMRQYFSEIADGRQATRNAI